MNDEGKIIAENRVFGAERPGAKVAQPQKVSRGWFWQFSLGVLAICILVWAWSELMNPQKFPIRDVQIKGNYSHIDHNLLRAAIIPSVGKGFFGLDGSGLQDRLSQLPWIYSAKVQRVWPDTLQITLTEQQPIAQYGETGLVNTQGDLFNVDKTTIPAGLPVFNGAVGQQKSMQQMYQQIVPILASGNLQLSSLTLDPRESWQLQLTNGLTVLIGQVDPIQRLQRFSTVYPQIIAPKLAMINTVDLRYAHGVAVRFKDTNR